MIAKYILPYCSARQTLPCYSLGLVLKNLFFFSTWPGSRIRRLEKKNPNGLRRVESDQEICQTSRVGLVRVRRFASMARRDGSP